MIPARFHSYFQIVATVHDHNVRSKNNIQTQSGRTNKRKLCLRVRGQTIWIMIPNSVKNSGSIYIFEKKLQAFIIANPLKID